MTLNKVNDEKQKKYCYFKSLLALHGIKSKDIADDLGVDRSLISHVLRGNCKSPRVKKEIARRLGTTVKELWGTK